VSEPSLALLSLAGGALCILAAGVLLLLGEREAREIAMRVRKLRTGETVATPRPSRCLPLLLMAARRIGGAIHHRIMSERDTEALARTLSASGLTPGNALPIFIGAKITCLLVVPAVTYLAATVLQYPSERRVMYTVLSLGMAAMLPNWAIGLLRRRYQARLRQGLPDALDLLVVCAEAGLGLESAVERVAREMERSNRPIGVEFSLLTHEMHILPDRRLALSNLAERTGQPALQRLAGTIAQTLRYGTPLGQGLRTLAAEMRNERMIQFEERAGKLPALLVLPMIIFILPCLFIVLMGQPVVQLLTSLQALTYH